MKFYKTKLSMAVLIATTSFSYATTNESSEKLDLIDVVAENSGAKTKTNVVTTEDVNQSTETDLRGLLREEPSINFGGGNGNSQWLTVRGMAQDQVDFKVDNTYSDTQIFHHQGRFNLLDPSLIKQVSIQKGTGSASAGIGATSGQIVARTVDAKDLLKEDQHFGFKVNTGFATNKGYNEGGTVFGKYGNVDALFSGNWITNKNYKDGNGHTVNKSNLNQRALLGKIGVDLNENHRIVFSQRQEHSHGERNLREEFDFAQSDNSASNSPRYRITNENTSNIQYNGKNIGYVTNVDLNAYYKTVEREETDTDSTTKIITRGVNADFDSAIGENHMLKYGINWREQEGIPSSITVAGVGNQEKTDTDFYMEGIWGFGPITLTTGLRHAHFKFKDMIGKEVNDSNLNPSLGLIWEATNDLSFNASHNYATRSPRLYEPAIAGGSGRRGQDVIIANSDLKAERSRNTEIGFNYKLSDAVELNGSYFWQMINDVVAIRNTATSGYRELYNGGKLKNRGYEIGASYRYQGLILRAGVADSKPELYGEAVDANTLAMLIGRTWTASVAYRFERPNIEIGWRGRFVESEKGSPSRGSSSTDGEINRPGYGVNDFFVNWKPTGKDDLNINFALDNAFNKYYKSHSQRTGVNSLPEAGRNFRVSMNYTF
ncbi:TonB-dependent receptor domain-containing protein [Glaesserella sp.]|uniref:TonB-dependent receptor domain-containing protein n=1 Tax=Glaesserella sp. TaxID=2094731 RepID=UPI0035A026EB